MKYTIEVVDGNYLYIRMDDGDMFLDWVPELTGIVAELTQSIHRAYTILTRKAGVIGYENTDSKGIYP